MSTTFPNPFWPENFFNTLEDDFYVFKKTGILNIETFFKGKYGMFFPVSITGSIIRNDQTEKTEYVLFIEDISKRKQAEKLCMRRRHTRRPTTILPQRIHLCHLFHYF